MNVGLVAQPEGTMSPQPFDALLRGRIMGAEENLVAILFQRERLLGENVLVGFELLTLLEKLGAELVGISLVLFEQRPCGALSLDFLPAALVPALAQRGEVGELFLQQRLFLPHRRHLRLMLVREHRLVRLPLGPPDLEILPGCVDLLLAPLQ